MELKTNQNMTPQQHQELIKSQIAASYSSLEKSQSTEDNNLEKGGEGSRGGKVIGHTTSGKPIYAGSNINNDKNYDSYKSSIKDYNREDHKDAYNLHDKLSQEALKRYSSEGTGTDSHYRTSAKHAMIAKHMHEHLI